MTRAQEQAVKYLGVHDIAALSAGSEAFIYGAGQGGRLVAGELARRAALRLTGFIDANPQGPVAGYPVFSPDHLATVDRPGAHVILASQFWPDIAESLPIFRHAVVHNAYPLILHLQGQAMARPLQSRRLIEIRQGAVADNGRLLNGLACARDGDLFHAADNFYRWLEDAKSTQRFQSQPPSPERPDAAWIMTVFEATGPAEAADKANDLASILAAASTISGGGDVLAHAAALALARHDAKAGRFDLAEHRLLSVQASSPCPSGMGHWPRNTLEAIRIARSGKPVPPSLARLIGDDNGYFARHICLLPFQRFDVQTDGSVLVCCGHWLPTAIGNVFTQEADEILNSAVACDIRRSMLDGSFKYCDAVKCGAIAAGALEERDKVVEPDVLTAMATGRVTVERAHSMVFALDQSCNLSCPSCRTAVIVEGSAERERKLQAIDNVILPLLSKAARLQIDTAGELFVSKAARKLLARLNQRDFPHLEVNIITNGTLFDERQWRGFPELQPMVGYVRVSTDAATRETFEKLRRGGRWDVFCANMAFIASLRRNGEIKEFDTSFTYQVDNFREIPDFIAWSIALGCDYINFEKLENIVFSKQRYLEKAVHLSNHPDYEAFRAVLRNPAVQNPRARFDIDVMNF